jgi:hypothetical protein
MPAFTLRNDPTATHVAGLISDDLAISQQIEKWPSKLAALVFIRGQLTKSAHYIQESMAD